MKMRIIVKTNQLLQYPSRYAGYYSEWIGPQERGTLRALAGKAVCRKCHPRCRRCTGYGFHVQVCLECTKYKRGEQCEDECPGDHFANAVNRTCDLCSAECRGCYGPGVDQCYKCRNYKVYVVSIYWSVRIMCVHTFIQCGFLSLIDILATEKA